MEGIADFLDSLIGGIDLVCYSLTIGGLFWGMVILRPWRDHAKYNNILLEKCIALIYKGAIALAIAQLLKIIIKVWLMTALLEHWPFPEFAYTTQFIGGSIRLIFILLLARYCYLYLRKAPYSYYHWSSAATLAIPLVISGAWLVHGAGRFDNRFILMSLTVVHQLAAAAWVGGIFQLVNLWILRQQKLVPEKLWPELLGRFSTLGIAAVAVLLFTGVVVSLQYIDSWNGFLGTGYGNLLVVKVLLLTIALGFAWKNRLAVQQYRLSGNNYALNHKTPYYIEAETFVLITLLFTAASLASQPPAVDIPSLTATWNEVLQTFTPRIPRITSPAHQALLAGEAGRTAIVGQVPSEAATAWSDYNHNISGIFLTVMSCFAMLSYKKEYPWARYWPAGFIGLGIFLFFRSDAETWPMGPIGFWESISTNGEVLQHRIATLLVLVLGATEIRARLTTDPNSKLPYILPFLAAFGGLMLLTHSHVGFQAKTAFLIQVGHTLMGVFALILAIGRWLELKLEEPGKSIAGFISVFALFQIGLILMFYREPLY
jgi:copper resistance protein D